MLIKIFTALSLLAGISAAIGSSLWPLAFIGGFVGCFLGLIVLGFIIVWIMSEVVDLSVPQERMDPFYRKVMYLLIDFVIDFMRIHVKTEGLEKTPKEGRYLLVCNHLNDVDPPLLMKFFPQQEIAFISKRENEKKFILGKFMHRLYCQSINRENDREALKTIINCINILKEDKASVGVFPEGWCSLDFKLHPFRPGVFKIAQKANVPIVVCTVRNTQTVFGNMKKLKPSFVELHLVDVIPAEELKGQTTVDIANRVHKLMADDLGPDLVLQENTDTP
jgi:1-acyl-sn-glycerol-3-phosphate acyltransferase